MAQARHGSINSIYAIERRAAFIATFLSNDPSDFSFSDLRSRITSSRGTLTTLKLSQEKLAWGEKNPNRLERRSTSAMVPYGSAELGLVKELFTEAQHPSVLLCVIRTTNKPGFRYEIMAFRLQSEHDVQLFVNLFTTLTQHQTPEVVRVQSRSTLRNRDELSYSPPPSTRIRPASTKLQKSVSMTLSPETMPTAMSPQSQVDGQVFRVVDGTSRRNQQYNAADSLRISGDRHAENRVYEVQPRSVNFAETRPGHSSVRMRSDTELRRPTMERAIDRTFATRNVGVMADLDSSIPRSRPGDYLPLEGELSSQHERMYIYEDGSQVGEVFCQTNLRSPSRTVSRRDDGSQFVWTNGQNDNTARTRMTGTSGLSHHSRSRDFADGADEIDSAAGREQRNPRNMQRRMTLVDNGVVKVTVEEYQDPAEPKTEELSPDGQSSDQTIDETDTNFDRLEVSRSKHVNRIQPVSGVPNRSSRSDVTGGHRSRQLESQESSPSMVRSPAMTSSVQRVFRRRSVPRSSSDTQHISHPVEVRQTGRRSSRRDDPVDRPYSTHEAVVHQSRPSIMRNEPMTYSAHRPYTMHDPVYQSEPTIMRREPMSSEKKRHHVHGSHQTNEPVYQSQPISTILIDPTTYPVRHRSSAHESVYQSQPISAIRIDPTTSPVRHRSIAHESVYQSQPITARTEPTSYPVRQHRSSTHESVYHSQPITIRAEPTIHPIRQHRSTTQESVYQSRPTQIRQKSVNSDYGHHERIDVYREPRNEYRLVAGTPGPVTMRQSKSRTMP